MAKRDYYFRSIEEDDGEFCYTLEHWKEYADEDGETKLTLYAAVREVGADGFYCRAHGECYLKDDGGCGKFCNEYEPRNGKNGICKHYRNTYTYGEKYTLEKINDEWTLKHTPEQQQS